MASALWSDSKYSDRPNFVYQFLKSLVVILIRSTFWAIADYAQTKVLSIHICSCKRSDADSVCSKWLILEGVSSACLLDLYTEYSKQYNTSSIAAFLVDEMRFPVWGIGAQSKLLRRFQMLVAWLRIVWSSTNTDITIGYQGANWLYFLCDLNCSFLFWILDRSRRRLSWYLLLSEERRLIAACHRALYSVLSSTRRWTV